MFQQIICPLNWMRILNKNSTVRLGKHAVQALKTLKYLQILMCWCIKCLMCLTILNKHNFTKWLYYVFSDFKALILCQNGNGSYFLIKTRCLLFSRKACLSIPLATISHSIPYIFLLFGVILESRFAIIAVLDWIAVVLVTFPSRLIMRFPKSEK